MSKDLLIGIDAGTSWIKAVAFDLSGKQIDSAALRNAFRISSEGAAEQSMDRTWADCVKTLRLLGEKIDGISERVAALSITAQGDGTWLADKDNKPVRDAWIWLDARSAPTVDRLREAASDASRYDLTGTGLNCCQMGAQLAHMQAHTPDVLERADVAFHCKDWLYFNLTGVRVADPSEAIFTFGDFRSRRYSDVVIDALGLARHKSLLPEIVEGTETHHPLSAEAAAATGLREGTPVVLGYVDIVCTALGAGLYTGEDAVGCTIVGSTGAHIKATSADSVRLNSERTGYVVPLPVPGMVAQLQTHMAATLNVDWLLKLASDLLGEFGTEINHSELVSRIDGWLSQSRPGTVLFHPYISEAGERGPFINSSARAGFTGLSSQHRFPDLVRGVMEGLGMAARDCYSAMGAIPTEVRVSGGAARSNALREIISSSLNVPVRYSERDEAGAAGAAMMAAVSIGAFSSMEDCIDKWVKPFLQAREAPNSELASIYEDLFRSYRDVRNSLPSVWDTLNSIREVRHD